MPSLEIHQWLQEDIESFIKEKLLADWLESEGIPEKEHSEYYLHYESGGTDAIDRILITEHLNGL